MSWKDRVKQAAFTSPSGVRQTFSSENVSVEINKRDSIREFPDFQGALVKNFGIGASSYPLIAYFWGDDHDLEADSFLKLLSEPGAGILEHSLYGRLENIVAFGRISRRDDLKTAANQSIFQLNFVQSAEFGFPVSVTALSDTITSEIDSFSENQATAYEETIKIETAKEKISLSDNVKAQTSLVKETLSKIAGTVADVEKKFNDTYDLIQNNISSLIDQPLELARSMINLVQFPARAAGKITSTLAAYQNLLSVTISQAEGLFKPGINNTVNNQFLNTELSANAAISGMIIATNEIAIATNDTTGFSLEEFLALSPDSRPAFTTKSEILAAISFLTDSFDLMINWSEINRNALGLLDTGDFYSDLKNAYNLIVGFLIRISFSTRQEVDVKLTSPRNFVELCSELYGILDNAFDFFILTNDLTGDEVVELPAGRRIIYYV